jgi:hypothetical protein
MRPRRIAERRFGARFRSIQTSRGPAPVISVEPETLPTIDRQKLDAAPEPFLQAQKKGAGCTEANPAPHGETVDQCAAAGSFMEFTMLFMALSTSGLSEITSARPRRNASASAFGSNASARAPFGLLKR